MDMSSFEIEKAMNGAYLGVRIKGSVLEMLNFSCLLAVLMESLNRPLYVDLDFKRDDWDRNISLGVIGMSLTFKATRPDSATKWVNEDGKEKKKRTDPWSFPVLRNLGEEEEPLPSDLGWKPEDCTIVEKSEDSILRRKNRSTVPNAAET